MEAVVKVGGSLAESPPALRALGKEFARLAKKHRFAVVPGGGRFADAVRELDARFALPAAVSHRMAVIAMDQYGLLLTQVFPNAKACHTFGAARAAAEAGRVAIILPSKLLFRSDPFEPSWDVTSDSIAAYLAVKLRAGRAVFVTDVDGIFTTDPKTEAGELLPEVSVEKLARFPERTSVDKFLPTFLARNSLDCCVVNGKFPQRVVAVLDGRETICTRIPPRAVG